MLDKIMAAVGIGSAQVDARLETDTIRSGETLRGEIHIKGGEVSQDIAGLCLDLVSEVIKEADDRKVRVPHTWCRLRLADSLTIKPGEAQVHEFSLEVPLLAPLSVGRQQPRTWLATRADIAMAVDPRDRDGLFIKPGRIHEAIFDAMQELGFRMTEAPLAASSRNRLTGCVQEFEFKPSPNSRFRHLDEAELAFLPSNTGAFDLLIQRDTKARGVGSLLSEMAGTDEQLYRMTIQGHESRQDIQQALERVMS